MAGRMAQLRYDDAEALLKEVFAEAEADFAANLNPDVPEEIAAATDTLMVSNTQAYREVFDWVCTRAYT